MDTPLRFVAVPAGAQRRILQVRPLREFHFLQQKIIPTNAARREIEEPPDITRPMGKKSLSRSWALQQTCKRNVVIVLLRNVF